MGGVGVVGDPMNDDVVGMEDGGAGAQYGFFWLAAGGRDVKGFTSSAEDKEKALFFGREATFIKKICPSVRLNGCVRVRIIWESNGKREEEGRGIFER